VQELDAVFATKTRAEWATIFDKEDLWWAPVQDPAEVSEDPQALAAGGFLDSPISDKAAAAGRTQVRMVAPPVDFVGGPLVGPRRPTPELGEHTASVVRELGLDEKTTEAVIAVHTEQRSKL